MRSRRSRELRLLWAVAAATAVAVASVLASPLNAASDARGPAEAWKSAFEQRSPLPAGGRMIVVLAGPSLAERVARTGPMSARAERRFVHRAQAFQRRLLAALRAQDVKIKPLFAYTRTFNGFSAVLDGRQLAALERAPGVVGIYPVRTVYPASVSQTALGGADPADLSAARLHVPGADGAGVTVAVLDTGIDAAHPSLAGKVLPGVDLIDRDSTPLPRASSDGHLETHGTRMAAIVAGAPGPGGTGGIAPGASILPIRVLGWQRTAHGGEEVLGRTDTLLAGLERAVDPNRDGDVADAARIALAAVVEPYASFPDSPEARAVAGARALGTLVVAAAGNDGPAGAAFGTVGGPGGAPGALAVGAADTRSVLPAAAVRVSVGGATIYSDGVRSLGAVVPDPGIELPVVTPSGPTASDPARPAAVVAGGSLRKDFVDTAGVSFVRGKAVVVPADGGPLEAKVRNAAAAGALAVLVYGSLLPAGGVDLEEGTSIPVVTLPAEIGRRVVAARSQGLETRVSITAGDAVVNGDAGRVAPFSSQGPSFDGSVKPDLVAPGVAVPTADAGGFDGTPRYATVSGSSAAAATVAGVAALVADDRPDLDAAELGALLAETATPLGVEGVPDDVTLQGAGLVDARAAAAADLVVTAEPGVSSDEHGAWSSERTLHLRNISDHAVSVEFGFVRSRAGADALTLTADPGRLTLPAGASRAARLRVSAPRQPADPVAGTIVVTGAARSLRVPWIVAAVDRPASLVGEVSISKRRFVPSLRAPAVVRFRAGRLVTEANGFGIQPVALLELDLRRVGGRHLGLLLRLRDVLPGRYAIGLTGRGPTGQVLPPGRYVLRLRAVPVNVREGDRGAVSTASVRFTIRSPR